MPNLTMVVDGEVLKKARRAALEKNTTVSALVRGFLKELAAREEQKKETIVAEIQEVYRTSRTRIGRKTWTREQLHER